MAACMPEIVVPRSAATLEMDTFITVLSRIMTNWASDKRISGTHFFIPKLYTQKIKPP